MTHHFKRCLAMTSVALLVMAGAAFTGCGGSSESVTKADSNVAPEINETDAQTKAGQTDGTTQAEQILRRTAGFYANANTVQVETHLQIEQEDEAVVMTKSIAMARPNLLAIRTNPEVNAIDFHSDGKTLTIAYPEPRKFFNRLVPAKIDGIAYHPLLRSPYYLPARLLVDDPYRALMADVTSCFYAGQEEVDGKQAHHLVFPYPAVESRPVVNREIWIAAEGDPLILKVVDNGSPLLTETYSDWKIDEPIDDGTFAFAAPAGAEEIVQLPGPGEVAPDIYGADADGVTFKLSDYRGKVVMLDFWADW